MSRRSTVRKRNGAITLQSTLSRLVAASMVILLCAGVLPAEAASKKPRPVVVSTNPIDGAADIDVQTSITVNFSLPMSCRSINKHTFRLKPIGWSNIAASSITCTGSIAVFTPSRALAVNTKYRIQLVGTVKAANGAALKGGFHSDFTTAPTPGLRPPRPQPQLPLRQIRQQRRRPQRRLPPTLRLPRPAQLRLTHRRRLQLQPRPRPRLIQRQLRRRQRLRPRILRLPRRQ